MEIRYNYRLTATKFFLKKPTLSTDTFRRVDVFCRNSTNIWTRRSWTWWARNRRCWQPWSRATTRKLDHSSGCQRNWVQVQLLFDGKSFLNTVGIWNPTIWNPETFKIQTFWRSDYKWSLLSKGQAISFSIAMVPTIRKSDHSKYRLLMLMILKRRLKSRVSIKSARIGTLASRILQKRTNTE